MGAVENFKVGHFAETGADSFEVFGFCLDHGSSKA